MVATLPDLVVPGFGAVGEVLVKIKEICVKIHDSKNACKRISMQLHDIFDEIMKLQSRQRIPSTCSKAITKYVGVLMDFTEFLERHQDKKGLEKLKERCKLPSKLERIQSDVEMLFRMLNLGTADMVASLKLRFEDEQREQRRELAKLSADTSIIRKEILGYRETMHKILSLLYSYQNSQGAAKKHLHDELSRTLTSLQMSNSKWQSKEMQMIETQIFSALSETPLPRKLDLPEWFLPDTEVTYEPKPCSRASFGSLHLGACNGTDVVVMCLNDGTGESLQTNERFQRYTTRWHGLDHLHVAKMLGVSHLSSPPLVIYEEVKYNVAGYLADSTNAGSMWRLLYETALGLRYAHNKKVLHGNLKLTTIRVDSEGHAKICGLGAVTKN